jgi:hypothetical protein
MLPIGPAVPRMPERSFIARHLDPADRIGETLFALIMALGFTGVVRVGGDYSSHGLLLAILGCNTAWAIVDGAMYVMLAFFARARRARLALRIRTLSDDAALGELREYADDTYADVAGPAEREAIARTLLDALRRAAPARPRPRAEDALGGAAVAILILLTTLPLLVPFALVDNPATAARASNAVALAMLGALGHAWARLTGGPAWRAALLMVALGLALVGVTIALGG